MRHAMIRDGRGVVSRCRDRKRTADVARTLKMPPGEISGGNQQREQRHEFESAAVSHLKRPLRPSVAQVASDERSTSRIERTDARGGR